MDGSPDDGEGEGPGDADAEPESEATGADEGLDQTIGRGVFEESMGPGSSLAHLYRGYDIWRSRVRTLQRNVFAFALDPAVGLGDDDWRERLVRDYCDPAMKIALEEAVAHRLRRVYLPLFVLYFVAWWVRITAFSPLAWPRSAAIGTISGFVFTVVVGFHVALVAIAFRPRTWHARGELRSSDLRKNGE